MKNKEIKNVFNKKVKILLIFLIIICIVLFVINKLIGKKAILEKLISGMNNLNYSYTNQDGDVISVFGKLEKIEHTNGTIEYVDYENKENYLLNENGKIIKKEENKGIQDMTYYKYYISNYFDKDIYKYSYKGKEEYNSYNCIVIEFLSKKGYDNNKSGEKNQKGGAKFWINDELNVIEKIEYFYVTDKDRKSLYEEKFEYHTGNNSLEQLKVPSTIK